MPDALGLWPPPTGGPRVGRPLGDNMQALHGFYNLLPPAAGVCDIQWGDGIATMSKGPEGHGGHGEAWLDRRGLWLGAEYPVGDYWRSAPPGTRQRRGGSPSLRAPPSLVFVVSQPVAGTCLRGREVPGCAVRRHSPGATGAAVRFHRQSGWLKQSPIGELPRGPKKRTSVWVVGSPPSSDWPAQSPIGELPRRPEEACMCLTLSNSVLPRHVRN